MVMMIVMSVYQRESSFMDETQEIFCGLSMFFPQVDQITHKIIAYVIMVMSPFYSSSSK